MSTRQLSHWVVSDGHTWVPCGKVREQRHPKQGIWLFIFKRENYFLFLCWKGLVWCVKIQKKDGEGEFYHDLVCLLGPGGTTQVKKESSYEKVVLMSPEHSDSELT